MYGTLSISDLLAATSQSVAEFGEDRTYDAIAADLAAHNAILREDLMPLVEMTTDRQRRWGGSADMEMGEADEYGSADAQKVGAGQTVAFPLRKPHAALQWTRDYFEEHTPSELAAQYNTLKKADITYVSRAIRRALFSPTNYTIIDRYVDNVSLDVKALLNADSVEIPPDRYGNDFDGATHTHYLARAGGSLVVADVEALIETVRHHDAEGPIHLYINIAEETAVRGFVGFTPVMDGRLRIANDVTYAMGNLDLFNLEDRMIGLLGVAEVWVKSWVPAHYMVAIDKGMGRKPLVWRTRRTGGSFGMLRLVAENEQYPLRAQQYMREFGVGVWNRSSAAVLKTDDTTYAAPTL